jgi:hypothetical protein
MIQDARSHEITILYVSFIDFEMAINFVKKKIFMACPTAIWNTGQDGTCDPRDAGYIIQISSHW